MSVINYQEYGDPNGPLLMFVHGGGVSGWMWDKQIRYFTGYHCVVPDLPGHGMSSDDTPFSIQHSAEQLLVLIEQKALGRRVIVVGFSLGSQVIIQMISMKPESIDDAVINSALVKPMRYAVPFLPFFIKLTSPLIKSRRFAKLQAKTLYVGEEWFETYYAESCRMSPDTLVQVLRENMSFAVPDAYHQAKTRILVTVGEQEKTIMKQSARQLVAANHSAEGLYLPKVGHGAPLATPELFNEVLERWLDGQEKLSGRRIE